MGYRDLLKVKINIIYHANEKPAMSTNMGVHRWREIMKDGKNGKTR